MLDVLTDGLPGVVAYYDSDCVCRFVNATVEAWTGKRRSVHLDTRLAASPELASVAASHVERALAGGRSEFEAPATFADGAITTVRGLAYPDPDAKGRVLGCFLLLFDITRERAFEAQLQAARDEAVEATRSKSRFLAAASHDLRQPLHAMTLFVSALARRVKEPETAELVGNVDDALRSLRAMIDTLLDISKLDAGLVSPNLTPTPLAELFSSLRPGFEATARDRQLEFRIAPTRATAVADRTLVEMALRNLLANAFKFTRSGGVLLGSRRRRGEVGLVVADTGVGVPPDQRESVFEEFHRAKTTAGGPNEGIGLGLAIVRRLAALMGGTVAMRSRPGCAKPHRSRAAKGASRPATTRWPAGAFSSSTTTPFAPVR
jgi:two-component system, sensor histidine kinase